MATIDLPATYETINQLQLNGEYEELNEMAQYIIDAIKNDGEKVLVEVD
jgi:hypothetical protein